MQSQLALLVIKTKDPLALKIFYEKLGLSFQEEKHDTGPLHYSCSFNGVVMEIFPLPKSVAVADTTTRLGFRVKDLDKVISGLRECNTTIVAAPAQNDWGYTAIIKDPDGRAVELIHQ